MTPKEEKERIAHLEKELQKVTEQRDGLAKRVAELEQQKPASKSRQMAMATLHLLEQGPVGVDQLAKINSKYPSDCVYHVRNILKQQVHLVRLPGGNQYMLPAFFEKHQAAKAAEKTAASEAKEEVRQASTIPQSPATGANAAVAAI
jgi:hypothetical protein